MVIPWEVFSEPLGRFFTMSKPDLIFPRKKVFLQERLHFSIIQGSLVGWFMQEVRLRSQNALLWEFDFGKHPMVPQGS